MRPDGGQANKAMSAMMRYAVEFEMTPSAHSRVDAGAPFDGGKFAGLLGPLDDPAERYFADIDRPGAVADFIADHPSNRQSQ